MPLLMTMENIFSILCYLPNMLTNVHCSFLPVFYGKNRAEIANKLSKTDTYTQKVKESEQSIITVYIYILFFVPTVNVVKCQCSPSEH